LVLPVALPDQSIKFPLVLGRIARVKPVKVADLGTEAHGERGKEHRVLDQDCQRPTLSGQRIEECLIADDLEAEARKVEAEIARLVDALATGASEAVTAGIRERERRLRDLRAQAEHLDGLSRAPQLDQAEVAAELRRRLDDWKGLLKAEPVKARQILRRLVVRRLKFTPTPEGYRFDGLATYGRLLSGIIGGGDGGWSNRAASEGGRSPPPSD
jgi:hypothetical protein